MLGSYVCRQCRSKLSPRIGPVHKPQWHPRATFLSLRQTKSQTDAENANPEAQPEAQQESTRTKDQSDPQIRHINERGSPQPRPYIGRYSRLVGRAAEDEGQSSVAGDPSIDEAGGEETAEDGPASLIHHTLRKRGVDRAWSVFKQHYTSRSCEAFLEPALGDAALLNKGKIFARLLNSVNSDFCNPRSRNAVTPTKVLFRYEQLGIAAPEFWVRQTLVYLTHQAILAVNTPTDEAVRDLPAILLELLSVWRLFFQCKGKNPAPLDAISAEWNIPALDTLPKVFGHKDFNMRLQEFLPNQVGNSALGFCAVYFYTLSDALTAIEPLRKEATPLIQLFCRLLAGSSVRAVFTHTQVSNDFEALPPKVKDEICKEISNAPIRALSELGSKLGSRGSFLDTDQTDDSSANLESFYLKRIARAIESKKTANILDRFWEEVETAFIKDKHTEIPRSIYNAFLSGYMVLFRAERSVEVWNHMIAHNIQPDIPSWVALLEGCKKAKDLNGFNAMWTRMLNTGLEPDNYAWTTRVHGLISLRQVNLALSTLDDMGKRWLSAETATNEPQNHTRHRGDVKTLPSSTKKGNVCTKPSIEVINGAVTALVQLSPNVMRHDKRIQFVQKILAWARNFSIKPDAITFNSLIKLYLRAADYATAYKILHQMEKSGIEGDVATYTMLISASLDNNSFDTLTKTQQADKIINLFNELEAGGLKLNQFVYSTAIDRLLKQYSNHDAVSQIMGHMHKRNIIPSAHVYTSLVTYYFQQSPPAIEAVDYLVNQFFTSHQVPTDRILFDRTIEGYAQLGEVGKMMSVVTRMSKHGTLPGWVALTNVIQALAQEGDIDRVKAIVRDVEMGQGVAQEGVLGGNRGEDHFFSVVRGMGLGSREERI